MSAVKIRRRGWGGMPAAVKTASLTAAASSAGMR